VVCDPNQDWDGVAETAPLLDLPGEGSRPGLRGCPGGWTGAYAAAALDVRAPAWFGFGSCGETGGLQRGLRCAKLHEGRTCGALGGQKEREWYGASRGGVRQSRMAGSPGCR
jgi:hypothetical protein